MWPLSIVNNSLKFLISALSLSFRRRLTQVNLHFHRHADTLSHSAFFQLLALISNSYSRTPLPSSFICIFNFNIKCWHPARAQHVPDGHHLLQSLKHWQSPSKCRPAAYASFPPPSFTLRIPQDIEKFSNSLSHLYSDISKPLVDIFLFAFKLGQAIGGSGIFFVSDSLKFLKLQCIWLATLLSLPPFCV